MRGGDIDLLIEPPVAVPNRIHAECRLAASLSIKLGGCRVDVLLTFSPPSSLRSPRKRKGRGFLPANSPD